MPAGRKPSFEMWIDGVALEEATDVVLMFEVEESVDGAATFRMVLNMNPITGDWDLLEHGKFAASKQLPNFSLLRRVCIRLSLNSDDPAESDFGAVVMDGYITALEPRFGEERQSDSRLVVEGMDAMALMHVQTVTKEWIEVSDSEIAEAIFKKYGFACTKSTIDATAPTRHLARGSMVQRCTDAEFLRLLARRNGFEVFVEHSGADIVVSQNPGEQVVGYFRRPRPDAEVQTTTTPASQTGLSPLPELALFPREAPSLVRFKARWDSQMPTRIRGFLIDERTRVVEEADVTEPGGYTHVDTFTRGHVLESRFKEVLPEDLKLEAIDLASTDIPHIQPEVDTLAGAAFREVDWFVRGTGIVRGDRYAAIMRPRRPVMIDGLGHLMDGKWYVQTVRHRWGVSEDDFDYEAPGIDYLADITVVRNALGGMG